MIHDGLWDPYGDVHMGNCAELCAREYGLSREEQDDFARESYRRARAAHRERALRRARSSPVEIPGRKGDPAVVDRDEEPFKVDLEKMAGLKPAFEKDGTVTAANACKINDGAAALVLTTAEEAPRRGLAADRAYRRAGDRAHRSRSGSPPRRSRRSASVLERAGLEVADIDLFEINEAFAVVALACIRDLGIAARPAQRARRRGGARPPDRRLGRAHPGHPALDALAERGAPLRLRRRSASAAARPPRWWSSGSRG